MAISQRPQNEGFMPKGMKKLNDIYTMQSNRKWPTSQGIWGIGNNLYGSVNAKINDTSTPRQGAILTKSRAISIASPVGDAIGYSNAGGMYVRSDGTLWAWGQNSQNNLGLPTNFAYYQPTQVGTDTNWEKVFSMGRGSWLGLKNGGELWACGDQAYGKLFNGVTTGGLTSFTRVQASFTWIKVALGAGASGVFTHAMALRSDGTLWVIGSNVGGKTGLGTTAGTVTSPTQVGTDTDWADVACSDQSTSAIKTNGTLWTCGSSLFNISNGSSVLAQLGTATDWAAVYGSSNYIMLHLKTNGRAYRSGQATGTSTGGAGSTAGNGSLVTFDGALAYTWKWLVTCGNYTIGMRTDGKLFYSGTVEGSPNFNTETLPQQAFIGLEEIGSLPTTAIGNGGSSVALFSY